MPYKFSYDKIKLPREKDRRVRITEEDKNRIRELYKQNLPIREIARQMESICSRRSIQYILFPERLMIVRKQFIERRKDGRYKPTKEKWAETMREHRRYKQKIIRNK